MFMINISLPQVRLCPASSNRFVHTVNRATCNGTATFYPSNKLKEYNVDGFTKGGTTPVTAFQKMFGP